MTRIRIRPGGIDTVLALIAATALLASTSGNTAEPQNQLFDVQPAPPCHDPMCVSFDSNTPNEAALTLSRTHLLALNPDVVVTTRGISHITADRVEEDEGANSGTSRWTFTGHVRADMTQGQLRSDTATVQIVDRQISTIVTQGSPALFQRPPPGSAQAMAAAGDSPAATAAHSAPASSDLATVSVRGRAQRITYDADHGRVEFSGDSWFSDGCNEITSPQVVYDLNTQTVTASQAPGSSGRVHGTIRNTRPGGSGSCTADTGRS